MTDMRKTGATIGAVVAFIIGLSQGVSDLLQLTAYTMLGGGIGSLLLGGFGLKKNPAERNDLKISKSEDDKQTNKTTDSNEKEHKPEKEDKQLICRRCGRSDFAKDGIWHTCKNCGNQVYV